MTKTLTEQWREGTLKGGIYYLLLRDGTTVTDKTVYIVGEKQLRWHYSSFDFVKEVVAPVPSYTELTLMAGNYRLAKKALSDCYNEMKYWSTMNHRCSKIFNHIKAALVEIEEVK